MKATVYHRIVPLAIGVLAGCGASAPRAPTPPEPAAAALAVPRARLVPGETITWVVTFAGMEAGRARLAIGEIGGDGHRAVIVRAEAQSSGLLALFQDASESVSSWVDPETGVPTQTEFLSQGRRRIQHVQITWAGNTATQVITMSKPGQPPPEPMTIRHQLPAAPSYDNVGSLALLRNWDAPKGTRATFWAFGGQRLWRTIITVDGEEELDTDLGRLNAVRLVATSVRMTANLAEDNSKPPRAWSIWISKDERRIPLLIKAHVDVGDVSVRVTSYEIVDSRQSTVDSR